MADNGMQVSVQKQDGATIVQITGMINSRTAGDLEATLLDQFDDEGVRIIVDFTGVSFLSSAGLRVLLMGAKRANSTRSKLLCCAMKDNIKDVFEKCGLGTIIRYATNRQDALSALR